MSCRQFRSRPGSAGHCPATAPLRIGGAFSAGHSGWAARPGLVIPARAGFREGAAGGGKRAHTERRRARLRYYRLTEAGRLARMTPTFSVWAVMLTIGLTGGIGSGKTIVADLLRQQGAAIIDADRLGHAAYTPHTEAWNAVVAAFGDGILTPEGEIDRRKLGAIVFADPAQLERLNAIMHPLMAQMVERRKAELRDDGVAVAVLEAAVLFEAGWDALVDEVWTTYTPAGIVVDRLRERNGLDETEARKRIDSQMPAEERIRRSHAVVENSSDLAALERAVAALWQARVKGKVNQSNG